MCVSHCHPNWADVLGYDSCALDLARYYKWRISAEHCDAKCIMFDAWMFGSFWHFYTVSVKVFLPFILVLLQEKTKLKLSKNDPNQN